MTSIHPNHPRYIPVIKWQSWEQRALSKVEQSLLPHILPCIEVRDSKQHSNLLKNLKKTWPHDVLIDYANPQGSLTGARKSELFSCLEMSIENGLPVRPVINPKELEKIDDTLISIIKKLPSAFIRLRLESFKITEEDIQSVKNAIEKLHTSSLIIDLGVSPKEWNDNDLDAFKQALIKINSLKLHSIHLLSGAYPNSLASVKTGVGRFERRDWAFWKAIHKNSSPLIIGYSDYGVLSPEWSETILERRSNRIAIRYTRDTDWLILRADGKKTEDSIAISSILVSKYASDFKGKGYSFGDQIIANRADPAISDKDKLCGHYHITEGWSHHIAHVLKEQY